MCLEDEAFRLLAISALDVLVVQYQSAFKVQCACAFVQSPVSCKCYRILPSTGCVIGYCAGYCTRDRLSGTMSLPYLSLLCLF